MRLLRTLGPAVISVLVAIVLWAFVRNLDRSSAVFTVPITWDAPTDVVRLPPDPGDIEVRVLATKPKLRLLQASDFEIRVSNAQGRLGADLVILDEDDVGSPFGVLVQQVDPSQFTVTWDRRLSKPVPVAVHVTGTPAPGYEVDQAQVRTEPATVQVTGPATRLQVTQRIDTEPVSVAGATSTVGPSRISLVAPEPPLRIDEVTHVAATVPVRARESRREFEDVPIEVLRDRWRTSPPNPASLRVTVVGPEPALLNLERSAISLRVDGRDLEPRSEDYFLEVLSSVDQESCPGCRVATLPQSKVHVNVKRAALPQAEGSPPADPEAGEGPGDAAPSDEAKETGRRRGDAPDSTPERRAGSSGRAPDARQAARPS